MAIKGATIKEGATPAFTGGSDVIYKETATKGSGVVTSVAAVADYRVRPSTIHTVKLPEYNAATGKWSKGKRGLIHKRPKLDTDGSLVLPLVRIEVEDHPIMSAAEITALWAWIAQVATDSEYEDFRQTGAMS